MLVTYGPTLPPARGLAPAPRLKDNDQWGWSPTVIVYRCIRA